VNPEKGNEQESKEMVANARNIEELCEILKRAGYFIRGGK